MVILYIDFLYDKNLVAQLKNNKIRFCCKEIEKYRILSKIQLIFHVSQFRYRNNLKRI